VAIAAKRLGTDVPPARSIITAKIRAGVLPVHTVARPRLVELLERDAWRVASITAGPGLGKSVLLLQWMATRRVDACAVVTLDQADNAPDRFWRYVVAALGRIRPDVFEVSARVCSDARNSETLVAQLLDDAATLDDAVVLAIEDLHTIRNQSILAALALLVENLPPQLRVVFTSRQDLGLPIARWRARSWLVEVRGAELAFNEDETAQLLGALGEHRLESEEIERLTSVTEGWAAALQLAAVAMRDNDAHEVVNSFCGRSQMIADFVGSEVIECQPAEMREFMRAIAIADNFDPDLCDALTGRNDSAERLRELVAATPFLVAVDDMQSTYRYHHLLRDVLRADLARRSPDRYAQLHAIVADVFERRGEHAAAAVHLVSAGDFDRAFDLVFAPAYELWEQGDNATVRGILDVFPVDYLGSSPRRMLSCALALHLCARFDESREWIERAGKALDHLAEADVADLTMLDALRVLAFNVDAWGDDGVTCGERALARVESGADIGVLGSHLREHIARAQLLADDLDSARVTLVSTPEGSATSQVLALGLSARLAQREGHLNAASDLAFRALTAAEAFKISTHVATVDARLAMVGVLLDRNDLTAAADVLGTIDAILASYPSFAYRVLTRLAEARIVAALDGLDPALTVLSELRLVVDETTRPCISRRIAAVEARLRLEADEARRATRLVERLPHDAADRQLLEARVLLAENQPLEACAIVERFDFVNPRDQVEAQLLTVRGSLMAGGNPDRSLRALVDLAGTERLVRPILDEGAVVARLVRRAAETSDNVVGERLAVDLGAPARQRTAGASELVVQLSDRERDVLRFLPSRLTTKEIASECFMSVNTAKAHLKRIYSKLGVSTRAEAVERAEMLGELRLSSR
jgi:LuxR family maltose regulon positive regulatory protein